MKGNPDGSLSQLVKKVLLNFFDKLMQISKLLKKF